MSTIIGKKLFGINHDRLVRQTQLISKSILIDVESEFTDGFKLHIIQSSTGIKHIVPTYALDDLNISLDFIDFINKNDVTAILPKLLSSSNEYEKSSIALSRPDLLNIDIAEDKGAQWNKLHRSKRENIKAYSDKLELGIAGISSDFTDLFLKQYILCQEDRSLTLLNYFDEIALNEILALPETKLFYAFDKNKPNSILFHLNILIEDTLYYYFSAPSTAESRCYSASLHWFVMDYIHDKKFCDIYSLGGGISPNDGIERFKLQLGAKKIQRSYEVLPIEKFTPGDFFPSSHAFLRPKLGNL